MTQMYIIIFYRFATISVLYSFINKLDLCLEIRRKDRILDNELAIRLLEEAEYGFLAMSGINGYGYGIPINYVKERGFYLFPLRSGRV